MAQTTLLTTISRNDTYPVYTNISAPHSCGTVKILVDSTYTEQMLYELPNITINIYTESDGEKVLYTSRALTMKVPEVDNPIESILVDIPTTCILAVIPEFDDTAFEAHNEAVCTSKEGTKWTEPTETFPITIIWDDTNIYAQQGEGGGGGGSSSASDITYDNSLSGLLGTNVQDAIDEVAIDLNTKLNKVPVQSKGALINGNGNINVQYLGNAVTGVKGNAESTYRTGNVNLTKENFGLGNVDNTSDLDKPISTATQEALDLKANITQIPTIDTELSATSENPVQNKAIYSVIGDINTILEGMI